MTYTTHVKRGQIELDCFGDGKFAVWFRTEDGKLLFLGANLETTGDFFCSATLKKLEGE